MTLHDQSGVASQQKGWGPNLPPSLMMIGTAWEGWDVGAIGVDGNVVVVFGSLWRVISQYFLLGFSITGHIMYIVVTPGVRRL